MTSSVFDETIQKAVGVTDMTGVYLVEQGITMPYATPKPGRKGDDPELVAGILGILHRGMIYSEAMIYKIAAVCYHLPEGKGQTIYKNYCEKNSISETLADHAYSQAETVNPEKATLISLYPYVYYVEQQFKRTDKFMAKFAQTGSFDL